MIHRAAFFAGSRARIAQVPRFYCSGRHVTAEGVQRARDFIARLSTDGRNRFWQWARMLAFRYGLEPGETEDLLQEAIWRLLARNPPLDSEDGFNAYLATTIRSIALDLARRRHMEARHGRVESEADAIERVPAEANEYEPGDLRKLLERLTAREREVAELTLQGYSAQEIAGKLSIEPATVRSLLRRVRARFAME